MMIHYIIKGVNGPFLFVRKKGVTEILTMKCLLWSIGQSKTKNRQNKALNISLDERYNQYDSFSYLINQLV